MNQLNSVLIEGKLVFDPEMIKEACVFDIETENIYDNKKTGDFKQYISYFAIRCYGKLAEKCMNELTAGREVRIVGHFKQKKIDGRTKIIAEHIETKPFAEVNKNIL